MTLPKSLTTVTTFSKILAMFLFLLLPFAGFYTGYKYHEGTSSNIPIVQNNIPSTPAITSVPSQITDPTANWKTYTNYKYNFSISYPGNWKLSTEPSPNDYVIFSLFKGRPSGIRLELYKNPQLGFCEGSAVTKSNIIFNNGTSGVKYECNDQFQALSYQVGNDNFLLLAVNDDQSNTIISSMASTFKFIR